MMECAILSDPRPIKWIKLRGNNGVKLEVGRIATNIEVVRVAGQCGYTPWFEVELHEKYCGGTVRINGDACAEVFYAEVKG